MPRIVLTRAMTYAFRTRDGSLRTFRRGIITEVDENTYNDLMRLGGFTDPDQHVDWVHPKTLRGVGRGSIVPIIRDVGLGDVIIVSLPVWELQRRMRGVEIVYGVHSHFAPIFREVPGVRVLPINKIRGQFTHGIDLRGFAERHYQQHQRDRLDLYCDYLLHNDPPPSYDYPLMRGPVNKWAEKGLDIAGGAPARPRVGIVVQASLKNRSWDHDYLRQFAGIALAEGWTPVMLDRRPLPPGFMDDPRVVDLTGKIDVEELKWVVSAMDVVVSPDTGTLHLAEAVGTKSVAIMTTVPPHLRLSHYTRTRAVYPYGKLRCLGCIHRPTCGIPDSRMKPCAQLSTPEMVWEQVVYCHEHEPPWEIYSWIGDAEAARRVG